MKKNNHNQGFVLLYSLLVSSVVLVIGLTLSNIILKQLIISSISREMNNSYYAANATRECLRFIRNASEVTAFEDQNNITVNCGSVSAPVDDYPTHTLKSSFAEDDSYLGYEVDGRDFCGQVEVSQDPTSRKFNGLISKGYNTDCDSVRRANFGPRVVERLLCVDFDLDDTASFECTGAD